MDRILFIIIDFFTKKINLVTWVYIFLPAVMLGGMYFSVRTGFFQITHLGKAIKAVFSGMFSGEKPKSGKVSPFQAVTTALSATVGTGNIIGTSQALTLGGYGAVFWLFAAGFFGMIIKYFEVVLAVKYRVKRKDGETVGGAMYCILRGMGKKFSPLAALFAVFAVCASFGVGNLSQSSSIASSAAQTFSVFSGNPGSGIAVKAAAGAIIALAAGAVIYGGAKRIGRFTEKVIPAAAGIYILLCLLVITANLGKLGNAFSLIIKGAFKTDAVLGATWGITVKSAVMWGVRRSAFSNEAGLGSAGIAHAGADTDSAVKQGYFGMFEVFLDTVVMCTLTAVAIIVGNDAIPFGKAAGAELVTNAFAGVIGKTASSVFISASLAFFAFASSVGWSLYGLRAWEYLFGEKSRKIYLSAFTVCLFAGAVIPMESAWAVSDTFNGLMAIPNFASLFALSGKVISMTSEYKRNERISKGGK